MPDDTPKGRLRALLGRMPLDRQHKENLLRDLETMDDAKAESLIPDLERIVETLEAKADPPKIKA